uniref:adenylate isopentenyltransferase 3, chloroplastic-like n=1 Tax=Erigeron canadensis TaxID=72917 RepID=UPI001CB91383|nr:adenylate isopentenyltransferase 3, chloroplastic-like [Erigeron canadensis]
MMMCRLAAAQAPVMQIPPGMDLSVLQCHPHKQKVVIVMGATGTGKSRLSIDLATGGVPAEIINSDKMQVYEGLDIVTNKITQDECRGVPHHLLGIVDPEADFTAGNFVTMASLAMKSIVGRGKLPIIAGGSNSFIEALVDNDNYEFRSRYDVCFLWVDVAMLVLNQFVSDRVDRMVAAGMVEEVRTMYNPKADYSKGIRRAIGVPEFDSYFRSQYSSSTDEKTRSRLLKAAIKETKANTCKLAYKQLEKIHRLRNVKGWKVHRLDATEVFQKQGCEADEAWAKLVSQPALAIVDEFLYSFGDSRAYSVAVDGGLRGIREAEMGVAMAVASY